MKNRSALLVLFGILMCVALHAQPPAYVPTDGLQLWYDFNTSFDDYDPNSLSIATTPNCLPGIDRFGDTNGSALFTQFNSNVFANIPSLNTPFVTGNLGLSMNLWYTADFEEESGVLAQCFDYDGPNGGWKIEWQKTPENTTEISASYRNFTTDSCASVVNIPTYDYAWHMATVVIDVSGINVYIDGVSLGTGSWQNGELEPPLITSPFTDPLYIGNRPTPQSLSTAFNGRIDDFGLWSRALTPQEITDLGTEPATAGCNNSNACNYIDNPTITEYDGSCSFVCVGCMLPYACNYDQNATINDASTCDLSCIADTITAFAFNDMNADGVFNAGDGPLEQWPLAVLGNASMLIFSNYEGYFYGGPYEGIALPPGEYTFNIQFNGANWIASLPAEQTVTIPSPTDTLIFALSPASAAPSAAVSLMHGYWDEVHCESGYGAGIYVENTGGSIINGTLRLFCDNIFETGPDSSFNVGPDSTGFGAARWTITDLYPGSSRYFTFHVLEDFGNIEAFDFDYQIQLESDGVDFYTNEFTESVATSCSPSPLGQVSANPAGLFSPQNFILNEDQIEYRIQFRNVGPGESDSVSVAVNLNNQQVDINSINVVATSLDLRTCLHDDGSIDFFAPSIAIPDTAEDQIASNQFITFTVNLSNNLEAGDSIDLDPIIAFNNSAVIYTSYTHRIFDCTSFIGPEYFTDGNPSYSNGVLTQTIFQDISTNFSLDLANANPYADSYLWILNGDTLSYGSSIDLESSGIDEVSDLSQLELAIGNSLCGEVFECDLIIGLEDLNEIPIIKVYPNPFNESCSFLLPQRHLDVVMYDGLGRPVRQWMNCQDSLRFEREDLKSGCYYLVARNENQLYSIPVIIE